MKRILIDPPVTPYSKPAAIKQWLEQLAGMPQTKEVLEAIGQAKKWLNDRESSR
jgi:hypothetical protein